MINKYLKQPYMTFTKFQQNLLFRDTVLKQECKDTYMAYLKKKGVNYSQHYYKCLTEIAKLSHFEMIQELKQKQLQKQLIIELKDFLFLKEINDCMPN